MPKLNNIFSVFKPKAFLISIRVISIINNERAMHQYSLILPQFIKFGEYLEYVIYNYNANIN